jgi:peptidyl-prolyl cis-trans isomerase SurA
MTLRLLRIPAAFVPATFVMVTALLAGSTLAQTRPVAPASPYGGSTVEDIIARVNDQIITRSDYDRAQKELDTEARQQGRSMQEISDAHKDLLRNLIDQQLWLSKGKELGVTGETGLIKQLDEIRKQYHLETLEDLEKAAKEQGVSFEDFKAHIRDGVITQEVMRDQVGRKIQVTPGELERYYETHKQEYSQTESVHLGEIMVSTGTPAPDPTAASGVAADDPAKLAAAKAKADDIYAKLKAGGDFNQLARSFSDGTTAAEGGDLGQFERGKMAKVLEDQTFELKTGDYTEPIRTRQGYVIFKMIQHTPGGIPPYKDVQDQVADAYYMTRMEPAVREYLTQMRIDAYIDIKPGYTDTGASAKQTKPIYSSYTPPTPKKKKKVERTRFRETTRSFRQKGPQTTATAPAKVETASTAAPAASMKPGKKEKIRYGQAPTKTLPTAPSTGTEDAGAVVAQSGQEPANPLDTNAAPEKKTRFSDRAKLPRQAKTKGEAEAPGKEPVPAPDAAEVADRQTQAGPLGLAGDTSKKKKKGTTTGEKTRLSDENKKPAEPKPTPEPTVPAPVPGAPAPAQPLPAPAPQP